MGMQLAREHPAEADLVMPVPDTGAPAAAGYAEASGIPYREGMVRNRYSGRTFIQPSQTMRQRGVTIKLNPLREVVRGKRLIVVDDSIVRGTTTKQIVVAAAPAGAAEVHVRISAPPIFHPCFYGIDTQIETELIAATHSVEEIREFIGADSLGYLSIGGVLAALELPYERFCFACFDGHYPEPVPYDAATRKFMLEEPPWLRLAQALGLDHGGSSDGAMARRRRASTERAPAGRRRRAGRAGRRADARPPSRSHAPPAGACSAGLGGFGGGDRDPGRAIREPVLVVVDRRRRHEDGDRGRARALRHDRHRPRRDVRRRRRLQRRRAALLPRLRRRRPARPGGVPPSSSAASRPAVARPAARSSAARPPSTRA